MASHFSQHIARAFASLWFIILFWASPAANAAPFSEMRFYQITEPGFFTVVPSYTAEPGETINAFARVSHFESTNKVTRIAVLLQNNVIAEINGLDVSLTVPFSLTFANFGEYDLTLQAQDSSGYSAEYRVGVRISYDSLNIIPSTTQPILAGETASFQVKTNSTRPMQLSFDFPGPVSPADSDPLAYRFAINFPNVYTFRVSGTVQTEKYYYIYRAVYNPTIVPARLPVVKSSGILRQTLGGSVTLAPQILSRGTPRIQWLRNGLRIPNATNSTLTLTNLSPADQGSYNIYVENVAGAVSAEVGNLIITNAPGGAVLFSSKTPNIDVRFRQALPDGELLGPTARAQLYAGRTRLDMRPVGPVVRFQSGYFNGGPVIIPEIPPGEPALVQVVVWDDGSLSDASNPTFEQRGVSRWWRSKILPITTTTLDAGGAELTGLEPIGLIVWDGYSLSAFVSPLEQTQPVGTRVDLFSTGSGLYTWSGVRVTNISYQWSKDGLVLPQTGSTLTLNNIQPRDAGTYRAAISDGMEIKVLSSVLKVEKRTPILQTTISTNSLPTWRLDAAPGTRTLIKTSTDLMNWSTWTTFDANPNGIHFPNPIADSNQAYVIAISE